MACYPLRFPDGTTGTLCARSDRPTRKQCREEGCTDRAPFLCDGLRSGKPGKTCDKSICEKHAHEIGEDRHLCPACHAAHLEREEILARAPRGLPCCGPYPNGEQSR